MTPIPDYKQWWPERNDWPVLGPDTEDEQLPGIRVFESEAMALLMLHESVCMGNADGKVGLFVMCSDTFAYACADGEEIPPIGFGTESDKPFWRLYDLVREHDWKGAVAWVAERRKGKGEHFEPIPEVRQELEQAGLWPLKEPTP